MNYHSAYLWAAIAAATVGCASTPKPTEAMSRAQASYEQADQADARRYDAANLESAKDKLAQAKAAAEKGDMKKADWLAQQADLDAQLAGAHARASAAQKAAEEVNASTATLRSETQRTPIATTP
jgi:hypothetical protein